MATSNTAGTKLGALHKLPAELRNHVYRHAVVYDGYIELWRRDLVGRASLRCFQPGLASTCKQIREEVLPIFYAENTFVMFGNPRNEDNTGFSYSRFLTDAERWIRSLRTPGSDHDSFVNLVQRVGVAYEVQAKDQVKMCCVAGNLSEQNGHLAVTCRNAMGEWCHCRSYKVEIPLPSFHAQDAEKKVLGVLTRCWCQLKEGYFLSKHAYCKVCRLPE